MEPKGDAQGRGVREVTEQLPLLTCSVTWKIIKSDPRFFIEHWGLRQNSLAECVLLCTLPKKTVVKEEKDKTKKKEKNKTKKKEKDK